jgi:hypothetical protein
LAVGLEQGSDGKLKQADASDLEHVAAGDADRASTRQVVVHS